MFEVAERLSVLDGIQGSVVLHCGAVWRALELDRRGRSSGVLTHCP
jgi:hypothetical protein